MDQERQERQDCNSKTKKTDLSRDLFKFLLQRCVVLVSIQKLLKFADLGIDTNSANNSFARPIFDKGALEDEWAALGVHLAFGIVLVFSLRVGLTCHSSLIDEEIRRLENNAIGGDCLSKLEMNDVTDNQSISIDRFSLAITRHNRLSG